MSIDRRKGVIHAECEVCGARYSVPDKGIGRAIFAAWETRHQHTTTADPERAALAEGSDA